MLRLHSWISRRARSGVWLTEFAPLFRGDGDNLLGRAYTGTAQQGTPDEMHQFAQKGLPLGSILEIDCGDARIDVETRAGGVEDIGIQLSVWQPHAMQGAITHSFQHAVEGGDSVPRCTLRLNTPRKEVVGKLVATIPPRYCGVDISTRGSITVNGAIKEAEQVSLRTRDGSLSCTSAISAKEIELTTEGGPLATSHLMANRCIITSSSSKSHTGAIRISGRTACLDLTIDAGCADIDAASIISNYSKILGSNLVIKNLNALEGKSQLVMAGSHLDVGGLDGSVKIDARNSSNASTIKVQVNENGRALSIQGNGETNVCILATPQLELELQTSAPCVLQAVSDPELPRKMESGSVVLPAIHPVGTEAAANNACRIEVCDSAKVTVERQSWIDSFIKRFDDIKSKGK